jgi:integrase
MASVHKVPKSKFWFAAYHDSDGHRRFRSTGTRDRYDAQKIADAYEKAWRLAREPQVTREQITAFFNDLLDSLGLEPLEVVTVAEFFDTWLASKKSIASSTRTGYEQACREFLAFLAHRRNGPLANVTPHDIDAFASHLLASGRTAGTVNKLIRKFLSGPFERARRLGKIPTNPIAGTEILLHHPIEKQRFTPEQVVRLLSVASPDWQGAILFSYGSGARLGDTCKLREGNIDIEAGVARFVEKKNRRKNREVVIALHPDFSDWYLARPSSDNPDPALPLFPTLAANNEINLSRIFSRLVKSAGIASAVLREGNGKGRRTNALTFHSFRHGAASSVINSKIVEEAARLVTQHSSDELGRYRHVDIAALKGAVALIPRLPK